MQIQQQGIVGHAGGSNSERICNCFLYPIKIENPILSSLLWSFLISVFLKETNLIMSLMACIAMFDCFLFYLHEKSFHGKKRKQTKMWFHGKAFSYKAGVLL